MMNTATPNNILKALRDIHQPDPISWWPLAPGWYILLVVCSIALFYCIRGLIKSRGKTKVRHYALNQLSQFTKNSDDSSIAKVSILLRQVALAHYPRHEIAGLHGEQWLKFLNRSGKMKEFDSDLGRVLLDAPYQKQPIQSNPALIKLAKRWVKRVGRV